MSHQRQVIREAVKAQLVAGSTPAGSRVFETRFVPYRNVELPAIAVYSLEEHIDAESKTTAPRELTRNLSLMIEAAVKVNPSTNNVDDDLDALCLSIEKAMDKDETFGGAASRSCLSDVDIIVSEESDRPVAVARMTYDVRYYTYAPDPADVTLDALKKVDTTYAVNGEADLPSRVNDELDNLDQ